MGDVPEGHEKKDPVKDARADALFNDFSKDIWDVWAKHQRAEKVLAPDEVYRVLCQALVSAAAVGAVDVGINVIQFIGMAKLTWDRAEQKAPKFS